MIKVHKPKNFPVNMDQPATVNDWTNIDDGLALDLIREILRNPADETIVDRNTEALEKRYGKPTGMLTSLIFFEGIHNEYEILEILKRDTIIRL